MQINVRNYDSILIRVNELILHEASHTIFTILRESFFAILKKKKRSSIKKCGKNRATPHRKYCRKDFNCDAMLIVSNGYLRSFIAQSQKLEVNPYESKLSFASEAD